MTTRNWIQINLQSLLANTKQGTQKWEMYGLAGTAYITTAELVHGDSKKDADVIVHFIHPNGATRSEKIAITFGIGRRMVNRDQDEKSNQYAYDHQLTLNTMAVDTLTYEKLCELYDAVYSRVMGDELRKILLPKVEEPINNE